MSMMCLRENLMLALLLCLTLHLPINKWAGGSEITIPQLSIYALLALTR